MKNSERNGLPRYRECAQEACLAALFVLGIFARASAFFLSRLAGGHPNVRVKFKLKLPLAKVSEPDRFMSIATVKLASLQSNLEAPTHCPKLRAMGPSLIVLVYVALVA